MAQLRYQKLTSLRSSKPSVIKSLKIIKLQRAHSARLGQFPLIQQLFL